MGNKLVTDASCGLRQTAIRVWQITNYGIDSLPGQKLPQFSVAVANKEAAQVFARFALRQISPQ
jgi:hypothetical protein